MPRPPRNPKDPEGSAPPPERPPTSPEYDVWGERCARLVPRSPEAKPEESAPESESPEELARRYQKELEKYRRRSQREP